MSGAKRCLLCELPARDQFGLCSRVSVTHDAYRHPERYASGYYASVWDVVEHALLTGESVFEVAR